MRSMWDNDWVFERLQVTLSGRRKRRRTLSIIMEELRLGRGIVRSKFSTGWSLVLNVKSWNMKRTTCSSVLWHGVLRHHKTWTICLIYFFSLPDRFSQLTLPCLILHGANDQVTNILFEVNFGYNKNCGNIFLSIISMSWKFISPQICSPSGSEALHKEAGSTDKTLKVNKAH